MRFAPPCSDSTTCQVPRDERDDRRVRGSMLHSAGSMRPLACCPLSGESVSGESVSGEFVCSECALRRLPRALLTIPWFVFVAATACGASAPVVEHPVETPQEVTWAGEIRFEMRAPTNRGASSARRTKPVRFVALRGLDAGGHEVARGEAGEDGTFRLTVNTDTRYLEVVAHIEHDGHNLSVTSDNAGADWHRLAVPIEEASESMRLVIHDENPFAGALHILDTMYAGSMAVRNWLSRELPPFYAYWVRGGTTDWSFYTGERGDTGRYGIELLGGEPGRQATTDTDEHDEDIILHEFGHFVMDIVSTNSSRGGSHPRGYLIDPGLAWEEGRATWFSAAVQGRGLYQDTIGVEPMGSLRVDHDIEHQRTNEPRGNGSEASVAEVLWDLADGTDALPDDDNDGVALGAAGVLRAMAQMKDQPGAFPSLVNFLQFLVETQRVEVSALKNMLDHGRQPRTLSDFSELQWPIDLPLPGRVTGKIDGVSDPAPSGGPNRAQNGYDAVRIYRVHVPRAGRLLATLTVHGTGRAADRNDLDLELRDIRAELLDSARAESAREAVSRHLEPGWYILYVRDGGGGNRVGYELTVELL